MSEEGKTGGQTTKSSEGTGSGGSSGGKTWPQSPKDVPPVQEYLVRTDCGDYRITASKVTFLDDGTLVLESDKGLANGFAPRHWKSVQIWREGFEKK
jgi:hypothetical protein